MRDVWHARVCLGSDIYAGGGAQWEGESERSGALQETPTQRETGLAGLGR